MSIHARLDARSALHSIIARAFVTKSMWFKEHENGAITVAGWWILAVYTHTRIILTTSVFTSMIAIYRLAFVYTLWPIIPTEKNILNSTPSLWIEHDKTLLILTIRGWWLAAINLGTGRFDA